MTFSKVIYDIPIEIAVSSCLAGEAVRYDGGDRNSLIVSSLLPQFFKCKLICPEMAIGLGVPRNPIMIIQASQKSGNYYLVDKVDNTLNYTHEMLNYTKQQIDRFKSFCGYVVKERSPSCGFKQTQRFSVEGKLVSQGAGVFTDQIMHSIPWLPIITESGIEDDALFDNFLERVFILYLWNSKYKNQFEQFKETVKHQLELRGTEINVDALNSINTITGVMNILKEPVTKGMQSRFLKKQLQYHNIRSDNILSAINDYQSDQIPLVNVIKMFQREFENSNIHVQSNYFYPGDKEIDARANCHG